VLHGVRRAAAGIARADERQIALRQPVGGGRRRSRRDRISTATRLEEYLRHQAQVQAGDHRRNRLRASERPVAHRIERETRRGLVEVEPAAKEHYGFLPACCVDRLDVGRIERLGGHRGGGAVDAINGEIWDRGDLAIDKAQQRDCVWPGARARVVDRGRVVAHVGVVEGGAESAEGAEEHLHGIRGLGVGAISHLGHSEIEHRSVALGLAGLERACHLVLGDLLEGMVRIVVDVGDGPELAEQVGEVGERRVRIGQEDVGVLEMPALGQLEDAHIRAEPGDGAVAHVGVWLLGQLEPAIGDNGAAGGAHMNEARVEEAVE